MLKWLGTRHANFILPVELRDRTLIIKPISQSKCQAPTIMEGADKKVGTKYLDILESDEIKELAKELEAMKVNDNEETPINFHVRKSTLQPTNKRRRRN